MANKNWSEALVDFIDDGGSERKGYERFFAAYFGCFLQHITIFTVVIVANKNPLSDVFYIELLIFSLFVSLIFALIISTGTKGGLIRRFWYGISLPIVCYLLAASFISSFLEIQDKL